ncbi:MAG: hypothetical protein HC770_01905 [Pseudanabaena sp. CRU_2_10]|nr:hypothetical protein [Pseudanabaena sp. CRU_2_10]
MDLFLAIGATALEAVATFVVVVSAGNLLLALLGAALPISVIWAAAALQSDRFEFASACEALIPTYETYIANSDEVSEDEMLEVLQIDATMHYLSGNGKNGYKSLAQVRFAAEAKFSWQRKSHYEQARTVAIRVREIEHKEAVKALPDMVPTYELDQVDCSPAEQKKQEWDNEARRKEWIIAETDKLEQELGDDLEFILTEYGQKISFWQMRATKAEEMSKMPAITKSKSWRIAMTSQTLPLNQSVLY